MSRFIFAFLSALVKEEIPLSDFGDRPVYSGVGPGRIKPVTSYFKTDFFHPERSE